MKDKHITNPNLNWYIVKSVPGYLNISKRSILCFHEKCETLLNYPDQKELFKKGQNVYQSVGMLIIFSFLTINQTISLLNNL